MSNAPPVIVWFRRDLRLADNPALQAAAAQGRPVIPVYVHDEAPPARPIGGASRWWLDKSLRALAADLDRLGAPLVLRRGRASQVLRQIAWEAGASSVYWNRLYDPASIAAEREVETVATAAGLACRSFNAALLNEPWAIATGAGQPFKVFTPYWRAASRTAGAVAPLPAPSALRGVSRTLASERLDSWRLHPRGPDWSAGFAEWSPGERGACARLELFLETVAPDYRRSRNAPAEPGTSKLSPHLHFGEIGPRQVWAAAHAAGATGEAPHGEIDTFLKELGWREFNHHLLFHEPHLATRNHNPRFDDFAWRQDEAGLEAWRRGRTGYPIVDAGMRQLWTTGWMHNRVRMIVASFLIKDLLIDWRVGEAWFWDTLVDADPANNAANWQWVAGSGADAAPYFRVFNPTLQAAKFDPTGRYVNRWVPADEAYRQPIIDHSNARARALAAYERLS